MADYEPFKAFTRFENGPDVPDPQLAVARGAIRFTEAKYSQRIQEILRSAAFRGEERMRDLAPRNTGELAKSIEVFPNTLRDGGELPALRGGSGLGINPGGSLGFSRGGAIRTIEVRIGGPKAPYAAAVVGGSSKAPKDDGDGKYVVFSPYKIGVRSILFKKKREELYEDRVGVPYGAKNSPDGVLIFRYRKPIPPNDRFVTEGVRTANIYVRRRIKNLNDFNAR